MICKQANLCYCDFKPSSNDGGVGVLESVKTIRLVIIEGTASDAEQIQSILSEGNDTYDVQHASSLNQAIHIVRADPTVDIVLCNVTLPDARAAKIFQRLKQVAGHLPIIFLADKAQEQLALYALQKGAEDYLVKDCFDQKC